MAPAKGMHPGAVWKKCDFQIHTPRDTKWEGPRFPGGTPELENAREAWADAFIAECMKRGITAIAVTDHHDLGFVPYIQRAITRSATPLWLFPGIEVTCNDAVQCIVLFDSETRDEDWERLFGGHLPAITKTPANVEVLPQATLCGKNIAEFISGVLGDAVLGVKAIALPHASDEGAHKSMMRQGFHERFKGITCDGVYTDKPLSKLDPKIVEKVHGKVAAWGSRRRGILTTSDNRQSNFSRLGTNDCWIRLGEPTVEAIRQALLADEARINYSEPILPAQRIRELYIRSTLTGENFQLLINDGFTAIIGGRGSGKSAVLEYLRFALGRSTADISAEGSEYERQRSLLTETLASGSVTVVLERNGVTEKWTRTGARPDVITVEIFGSGSEEIGVIAAQQRFRARAFSQKQLSSLLSSAEDAAEQITGIAAAEEIDKRQAIEEEIARAKREIFSAFDRVVDLWSAQVEHQLALSSAKDLDRRIEANKKRLGESGLSDNSKSLLADAPVHNSARDLLEEAKSAVESDIEAITQISARVPSIDSEGWHKVSHFEEISRLAAQLSTTRKSVKEQLEGVENVLNELKLATKNAEDAFDARFKEFTKKHDAARKEMVNLSGLLEESSKLLSELQEAESRERKSASRLSTLQDAEDKLSAARSALKERIKNHRQVLGQAALKVSGMSDGMLRARVETEVIPKEYVSSLLELCESSRVRDAHSRCHERVEKLLKADSGETWDSFCDKILELAKARLQARPGARLPHSASSNLNTVLFDLTDQQSGAIYENLTPIRIASLLASTPADYISFEYRDRHRHIPFQQASPGQQAAALLNLLLRQEAGTLIIDQPEDDLDNRVIMDIVRLLQTAKRKRQLIFATHNANFLVNGDADKVVALMPSVYEPLASTGAIESPRVSVEMDGAIETAQVRTLITDTVEGGRDAFELRSRKYKFRH